MNTVVCLTAIPGERAESAHLLRRICQQGNTKHLKQFFTFFKANYEIWYRVSHFSLFSFLHGNEMKLIRNRLYWEIKTKILLSFLITCFASKLDFSPVHSFRRYEFKSVDIVLYCNIFMFTF